MSYLLLELHVIDMYEVCFRWQGL